MLRFGMVPKGFVLSAFILLFCITPTQSVEQTQRLTAKNGRFLINDVPVFLLGISYFDAMSAHPQMLESDLTRLEALGFRAIRIWGTWYRDYQPRFVSLIRKSGSVDGAALANLRRVLNSASSKGMVIDLTFSRDPIAPISFEAYRNAIRNVAVALKPYRNVLFDVQNETDHCGNPDDPECTSHLSLAQVRLIRDAVKAVDPQRMVTASRSGFSLVAGIDDYAAFVSQANVDWIATHRPPRSKDRAWAADTDNEMRLIDASIGKGIPVVFDEPNRCGQRLDCDQSTSFSQFILAARNAKREGAAGWFFHTKASFKLSGRSMFEQLNDREYLAIKRLHRSLQNIPWP